VRCVSPNILVHGWLTSIWSERFWTWLNGIFDEGQNPGFASDIELVLVLAFSFSIGLSFVFIKIWKMLDNSKIEFVKTVLQYP
jgi:hypothetical protein